MKLKLKRIKNQVIVITGASSGIGLATAEMAVKRGARVVLASRNQEELHRIAQQLNKIYGARGQAAAWAVADVAEPDQVQNIADTAVRAFGGFDTWVNNAAVSIYGRLREIPLVEKRRLFDVNFWGVVHGCRSALPHLRSRGGAIINIGSVLSERAIPIQGIYSASKHAVKAYTDALRMECEADGLPVSVTLIKPAAIDTPYTEHARNHMPNAPTHQPPVYAAEVAAEAILACAQAPRRDLFVGGGAAAFSIMERFAPRVADRYMERAMMEKGQMRETPEPAMREDALFSHPRREGRTEGDYEGHVSRSSAYTSTALHPARNAAMILAGIGLAGAALALLRGPARAPTSVGERGMTRWDDQERHRLH